MGAAATTDHERGIHRPFEDHLRAITGNSRMPLYCASADRGEVQLRKCERPTKAKQATVSFLLAKLHVPARSATSATKKSPHPPPAVLLLALFFIDSDFN
ncbi:hypothetical protein [Methylobacterium brachiatum]|uniref:hypothetical protein n=1 Tax=Methylobacterium brachiatum TaxID=269660 RepID=UPI0011142C39|nr:hypothetical protein [Methylobacterium brachiatum]